MGGGLRPAHAIAMGTVLGLAVEFPARAQATSAPRTQIETAAAASAPPTRQETASLPQPTSKREPTWYGWQILLADAASGTLMGIAATTNGPASAGVFYLGLGTYLLLDGPIVHWANGNPHRALESMGLRAGLSFGSGILAAAIGAAVGATQNSRNGGCDACLDAAEFGAAGFVHGMFVATILDVALLAFEEPPGPSLAKPASLQLQLAPVAGLPRDSAGHTVPTFGIAGSF
jgi:hypothetical protein